MAMAAAAMATTVFLGTLKNQEKPKISMFVDDGGKLYINRKETLKLNKWPPKYNFLANNSRNCCYIKQSNDISLHYDDVVYYDNNDEKSLQFGFLNDYSNKRSDDDDDNYYAELSIFFNKKVIFDSWVIKAGMKGRCHQNVDRKQKVFNFIILVLSGPAEGRIPINIGDDDDDDGYFSLEEEKEEEKKKLHSHLYNYVECNLWYYKCKVDIYHVSLYH